MRRRSSSAALYLWGFFLRPVERAGAATIVFLGQPTEMLVTLLVVVTLMGPWVFGSDTLALAFTQAEVSMLFPAPLSRRALIGYKLFRAQVGRADQRAHLGVRTAARRQLRCRRRCARSACGCSSRR